MKHRLELTYPTSSELKNENKFEEPLLYNHFSYFNAQCTIIKVRSDYRVITQNFIPIGTIVHSSNDYSKEWFCCFETSNYVEAVYYFQKLIKEMINCQNYEYLSRYYNNSQLFNDADLPIKVKEVIRVFG